MNMREKLKLSKEISKITAQLLEKGIPLKQRMTLLRDKSEIIKTLLGSNTTAQETKGGDDTQFKPVDQNDLIQRYNNDEFINEKGNVFSGIMVDVFNAGLELLQIKSGLERWIENNPTQLQQEAA